MKKNNILVKIWAACFVMVLLIVGCILYPADTNIDALRDQADNPPIHSNSKLNIKAPDAATEIPLSPPSVPELPPSPVIDENPFYLTLVNQDNTLAPHYYPENLINIYNEYSSDDVPLKDRHVLMNQEAYLACREMFLAAKSFGMRGVYITSAFRDYTKQDSLYSSYLSKNNNQPVTPTLVAPPGESEHQTGLAIDLEILPDFAPEGLDLEFTDQGKWYLENCWYYGFILRYPANKTHITNVVYEPWHFRYVGKDHALSMKNSGLCLEEYIESLYN